MLKSHINAIEKVLIAKSRVAQQAGHTLLRGGPREWFIREFLEGHLPTTLEIGSGEIIDENSIPGPPQGEYRNQVDIVIYRRDFPKIQYATEHYAYLSEGVMATIESKSNLVKGTINSKTDLFGACFAANTHKTLHRTPPEIELVHSPPPGIISYVVAYNAEASKNIATIARWLPDISLQSRIPSDNLTDMIVVLGKGVIWNVKRFKPPDAKIPENHSWAFIDQEEGNLLFMFIICFPGCPTRRFRQTFMAMSQAQTLPKLTQLERRYRMEIDVYKAQMSPDPREVRRFLFVPSGQPIENLPKEVVDKCGKLYYQKTLNLESDENRIGLDTNIALSEINRVGYFIKDTNIITRITETV